MTIDLKSIMVPAAILILSLVAAYYHSESRREAKRADDAENSVNSAEAVTTNVLRTVSIMNRVSEANQRVKDQMAQDAQKAASDIKAAIKDDDCAVRNTPAAADYRLRQHADSLRNRSISTATGTPDR